MTSFRPSNPVARSLIKIQPLPLDHPTKPWRPANHSGVTLPKVKPCPVLPQNNNKMVPNNAKANQFEHLIARPALIAPPRRIADSTSVSSVPDLSRGPQIAPVDFSVKDSRFRPISKQIFSQVYPLCQIKRKHDAIEVPETDEFSEIMPFEPEYRRRRPSYAERGRTSSNAELSREIRREISMSPLARILSAMPEI